MAEAAVTAPTHISHLTCTSAAAAAASCQCCCCSNAVLFCSYAPQLRVDAAGTDASGTCRAIGAANASAGGAVAMRAQSASKFLFKVAPRASSRAAPESRPNAGGTGRLPPVMVCRTERGTSFQRTKQET
jgi:hypothetical protein